MAEDAGIPEDEKAAAEKPKFDDSKIDKTFKMSVELSVLESLGINLYSNAAAVLSELVANAYDADADTVSITWLPVKDKDGKETLSTVVVSDDGCGMEVAELNARFLTAGYKKRPTEGTTSPKYSRPFMGRKGIGKLSVFSLAEVVDVYSKTATGNVHGFTIVVKDLEDAINDEREYFPQPIDPIDPEFDRTGTTLVLSQLKTKRAGLTASALRKRLARRFDVLDETELGKGGFHIAVNEKRITYHDRMELRKLEFIWEFGPNKLPAKALPKKVQRFAMASDEVDAGKGWKISGWFGTTKTPTDLTKDEEAGSLKNIIVLARKRPIQEGIIEKLDFSRLFGNYVTGQIEADFLDLDEPGYDDIATSDRQRLIEDDERVQALQKFLRTSFIIAADQWSAARPKRESEDALKRYPKLQEWVDDLPDYQRDAAQKMIGTIAGIELEGKDAPEDRAALFRSGILAFARVGLRKSTKDLELLTSVTAVDLLPLLGKQEEYEAGLWVDILRSRVEAIEKLRDLTDANEKEKVLQEHLFNHLWLLDPSWERATGSEQIEEDLRKIAPDEFATDAEGNEIRGRIDIRYATQSGRHVIVELKRYERKIDVAELVVQGTKYVQALASLLTKKQRESEIRNIEVIFVLGSHPTAKGKPLPTQSDAEYIAGQLEPMGGSYRLYDALIDQAQFQYQDYLDASGTARKLDDLIAGLDPVEGEADEDEDEDEDEAAISAAVEPAVDTTPAPAPTATPRPTIAARPGPPPIDVFKVQQPRR
jgi:hypothetical protein